MIKERLERLQRFSAIDQGSMASAMAYFLEKIAGCAAFVPHEKIFGISNRFCRIIRPIAQSYGEHVSITATSLFWITSYRFVYGLAEFSNQLVGILYYFEKTRTGMIVVSSETVPLQFFRLDSNKAI